MKDRGEERRMKKKIKGEGRKGREGKGKGGE